MALSSLEMEALRLSLQVALLAIGVSLPLGIAMAWVLVRKTFPGRILLDGIVHDFEPLLAWVFGSLVNNLVCGWPMCFWMGSLDSIKLTATR